MPADAGAKVDSARRIAVTALLGRVTRGDAAAADELMSGLYPDLHRIAARAFRHERPNHTLQPTALVNEAFIRTFGDTVIDWRDRAHFFALMARQIRRILVDHGRAVRTSKRGSGMVKESLDDSHDRGTAMNEDVFALNEALALLETVDPRSARVVELKYFGGLTESEIAEVLGVSMPTVTRDWKFARTWLHARLVELPE